MRQVFVLLCAVLTACLPLPGSAEPVTHAYTLSNGLRVFIREDHRAPVVVSQVWYRAGSIDEHNGATGVAHVLEHMMFKGTKKVPAGQFSRLIAAAGGRENAFTANDYTVYFQQLHHSKLGLALKLEADRMQNLVLAPKDFSSEIKVVMEERRWRLDDQPQAKLGEQLMATAFEASPYRWPILGWMNDLQNMTVADARDWYQRWYAPNNAVLVIVGDVKPEAVMAEVRRYFGPVPRKVLPVRKVQHEPEQLGVKRLVVKAPAKWPYLAMAWHAPVLKAPQADWEPYALEVLAGVLDANEASRLDSRLIRETRVASNITAGYEPVARGGGRFTVEGTPTQGHSAADLEAGIRQVLESVKQQGVTQAELEEVKTQIIAHHVFEQDSDFYQAMQIGQLETVGLPYTTVALRLKKIQQVTPAQVQAVARKYLNDDALTVAVLDPQPIHHPQAPAAAASSPLH